MLPYASFVARSAAASLLLAAHTPALAGSSPALAPWQMAVLCDPETPPDLCAAIRDRLNAHHPVTSTQATALSLGFSTTRQGADMLAGHLQWSNPDGSRATGPTLELTVMDHGLTPALLHDYAEELIRQTALPL